MTAGKLSIDGAAFRDAHGRHVLLRGVNFGGDCKVPYTPNGHTHLRTDFSDHRTVSFIGRPAPLAELDPHLKRLQHWGFNCLRLLTTWEAVEHAGPGAYDDAYLDYFAEVCRRAGSYGLHVFIDFHQDVWSRMSGGDGAPGWTFEAVGLDFTQFDRADAALVMQHRYDPAKGGRQKSYPTMSWSSNYGRPANRIMWTLFFAGDDFAPGLRIDGLGAGAYLQKHYLGAMAAVAQRVRDMDHVIGFDTLNEPGAGFIGLALDQPAPHGGGPAWSPLDCLAAASGRTRTLSTSKGPVRVNEAGISIWRPSAQDPFREAGAWDLDASGEPVALRPDYFQSVAGKPVDLGPDYMSPFFHKVASAVRAVRDDWLVFAEVEPAEAFRHGLPPCPERTVNASHWYDVEALRTKRFNKDSMINAFSRKVLEGANAIEASYVRELSRLKQIGEALNGGSPSLVGEFGIQVDMNDAEAFARWASGERGDQVWEQQNAALDLMYNAMDRLLLSSTLWNYTASNRNDPMIGDGWNQEDLSIYSADQETGPDDPNSGGRAVAGFCRPYVQAAQGRIVSQRFDSATATFDAVIDVDKDLSSPTLVYAPALHYAAGYEIDVQGGELTKATNQVLEIRAHGPGFLTIRISISRA